MKRLLAVLLCLAVASSAYARHPHGGGSGSGFTLSSAALPGAVNGQAYSDQIMASGGAGCPCSYAITSGPSSYNNALLLSVGGVLSGTPNLLPPNVAENDTFTVEAWNNSGQTATGTFTLATAIATGSIGVGAAATLAAGTEGSGYFAQVDPTGGVPPYYITLTGHTSNTAPTNSGQSYAITTQGMLQFAPTTTGTDTFTVNVLDSVGSSFTTASNYFSATVNNTIAFGTPPTMPSGMQGAKYRYQMRAYGGSGSGYTYALLSGGPPGLSLSSGGEWTGTPTNLGLYSSVSVKVTDSSSNTATQTFNMAFAKDAQVSRPSYNASTDNGFFVLNGQLYDPNGWPFRIRGVNRLHVDQASSAFVPSNANTIRVWPSLPEYTPAQNWAMIDPQILANGILPILALNGNETIGSKTSGSNLYGAGTSTYAGMGDTLEQWQSFYSTLSPYMESLGPLNIANEWGTDPVNNYIAYLGVTGTISSISGAVITINTVSATNPFAPANTEGAYLFVSGSSGSQFIQIASVGGSSGAWTITATATVTTTAAGAVLCGGAVAIMRNIISPGVGYTAPLMIDLPYFGEDNTELQNYGAAILASDPLQNVIFSAHRYGASTIMGAVTAATVSAGNATVTSATSTNGETLLNGYYANYIGGGAQAYFAGLGGLTGINGIFNTTGYPTGGGNTVQTQGLSVTGTWTSGGYVYDSYYYALCMQQLNSIASANNLLVVIGEIGPGYGLDGQYSAPQQYIQAAEHYGLGWMTWAIDDGSGSAPTFDMPYSPGVYAVPADLKPYGQDVILNPQYGLTALTSYIPYFN